MKTTSAVLDPSRTSIDEKCTALTRARYQRISPIYDRIESLMKRRFQPWREKLWQFVCGPRVLEVGDGTGKTYNSGRSIARSQPLT